MTAATAVRHARRLRLPALVVALRPHQWTKNLLLLAGLLFSGSLADGDRWVPVLVVLTAYCLLSSAGYLVNDVRDAASDRLHPTKRLRPVASGEAGIPSFSMRVRSAASFRSGARKTFLMTCGAVVSASSSACLP